MTKETAIELLSDMRDGCNRFDPLEEPHYRALSMGIEAIKKPQWIPCSEEPTLYGYNIEHLAMIAKVMEKYNVPPQKIVEILSDAGKVAEMIYDEQTKLIRKEVERWT